MKKLVIAAMILSVSAPGADKTQVLKTVVVYKESGRFGGWPANNGIWVWGNEIVVGFMQGYFKNTERGHAIDNQKPNVPGIAAPGSKEFASVPGMRIAARPDRDGSSAP